jgi:hypothetical protein
MEYSLCDPKNGVNDTNPWLIDCWDLSSDIKEGSQDVQFEGLVRMNIDEVSLSISCQ